MSIGLKADPGGTSGAIQIGGTDKVIITNAGDVAATTFTGSLVGNADTATKFAGTTGTAPVFGVRAWVNFDGTRDTSGSVSTANTNRLIRASGNVSSVLRNSTGAFTINFTIPMEDSNYAALVSQGDGQTIGAIPFLLGYSLGAYNQPVSITPSAVKIYSVTYAGNVYDALHNHVAIIR